MTMNLRENLLLDKSEIEKALGMKIENRKPIDNSLKAYIPRKRFSLHECIALLNGFAPYQYKDKWDINYEPMEIALREAIEYGELIVISTHQKDYDDNSYTEILVERNSIEQWAKNNNYDWILPPQKETLQCTKSDIQQAQARIAELEKQNTELKQRLSEARESPQKEENKEVLDDDFSLYGHKSELLEILMRACKEFWANGKEPPN
ncbi:hypothetical protein A4G19_02205 [Pasteurellaceae bacterium Macca]|nr:hypothetical protein [Pasteurellaceae bacterium Macca]